MIVVIGAGPIGIYTAERLIRLGHKVTLLESGNLEQESSLINRDSYLFKSESAIPPNVHRVGGGSNYWHARFGEFLDEDFQNIDGLNVEGWPYPKSALSPHYKTISQELTGIALSDDEYLDNFMSHLKKDLHPDLALRLFRFAEEFSFVDRLANFRENLNFTLITNCRVDSISPAGNLDDAKYVCNLTSNSGITEIHGTEIIICAGTLQSTKLILNSKNLIGVNDKKIVGQNLMEHLEGFIGTIKVPKSHFELANKFVLSHANRLSGFNAGVGFKLNSNFQGISELPSLHLELRRRPRIIKASSHIGSIKVPNPLQILERVSKLMSENILDIVDFFRGIRTFGLWVKSEEFGNSNSRVFISTHTSGEVLVYDHQVSDLTYSKLFEVIEILVPRVAQMFNAKITIYEWVKNQSRNPRFETNWHPMGTLPMGSNADTSICDPALQLHSNDGVYVLSPAVFKRGSNGNPTFTTLALASKLLDEKFSFSRTSTK